ncbi:PSP1 domain-containing protein [Thermosulfuriphilus sp.]
MGNKKANKKLLGDKKRPSNPKGQTEAREIKAQIPQRNGGLRVVEIRLRPELPTSHFDAKDLLLAPGDWVLVEGLYGPEVGQVVLEPIFYPGLNGSLPTVLRRATPKEIKRYHKNLALEDQAWDVCEAKIKELGLEMKLTRVERLFDGSKIIFYYTADGRVDFRQLVKELVRELRSRIEMRQIGVRHEAKMLGGLGTCGRELCCASFIRDFDAVSIRMAKEQSLPLNPNKISGICGRLLCCLVYEHQVYLDLKKEMPKFGKRYLCPQGEGKVIRHNIFRRTVTLELQDGREVDIPIEQVRPKEEG